MSFTRVQVHKSDSTLYILVQCKILRRISGSKKHEPACRLATAKPVLEAGQLVYGYKKLYIDGAVSTHLGRRNTVQDSNFTFNDFK